MLIIVTGGSGSGKSAYAESRIVSLQGEHRYYIATMKCYDRETEKRIERHRAMRRGKGFETIEQPVGLRNIDFSHRGDVLLECMSNLAANEMFDPEGAGEEALEAVISGVRYLMEECRNVVIVTNEIFSDGIEYDPVTTAYQKLLGQINVSLSRMADEVVEVVCGIPIVIKNQ